MDLAAAITSVLATLRRRPADLLPFYLLGTAVPVIARMGTLAGLIGAYVYLAVTGRLKAAREALTDVDLQPPDADFDDPAAVERWLAENPDAVDGWVDGILPIVETVFTPTTIFLLVSGFVVSIVLAVVTYSVASAGQMSTVFARLRGDRGLVAGVAGARTYWLTFLGLYLAELFLWIGILLLTGLVIGAAFLVSPLLGALVALGTLLVVFFVLLGIRILFAFAPAAVVVDDAGIVDAVSGAGGFVRSNPADAAAYLVVAVGVLFGVSAAASTLAFIGAGAIVALGSAVVIAPILDLLKTVLYGDYRGAVAPVEAPDVTLRAQTVGGLRRGWTEMVAFVRETPGLHVLTIAVAVGAGAVGWWVAAPFADVMPTSIEARLVGHIPPVAAVEFFGNNWTVAISTALAGVALAIPALAAVAFNGVVLGAVTALEANLVVLAAFVTPHGLFEIPALIISGALGLYLGGAGWRTFRGRADRTALADALERAFWVLVGVGILIGIAAVIEGFISPYYWRLFL